MSYKVAQSGEVFYIYNNRLCIASTVEEMQHIISVDTMDRSTYFHYSVKGVNYKTLIVNRAQIGKHLKSLPIDNMMAITERYHKEYEEYMKRREAF